MLAGMTISDLDQQWLARAVDLAEQALETGNDPYGSVLVAADDTELFADHNRTAGGDDTRHPEFAIARWAVGNLTPEGRSKAVVYTSGEHCPMCAAAHGWVGLGRIVYAASAQQIAGWRTELGRPAAPVAVIPARDVIPEVVLDGPDGELTERVKGLFEKSPR